jgi:hypothetical protein
MSTRRRVRRQVSLLRDVSSAVRPTAVSGVVGSGFWWAWLSRVVGAQRQHRYVVVAVIAHLADQCVAESFEVVGA